MARAVRSWNVIAIVLFPLLAQGETIDVMPVWSGHPVGFALLTHQDRQFVVFYDAQRQMTVGVRTIPSSLEQENSDPAAWHFMRLPEKLGWDSHNYGSPPN